jgi:predicted ester cyclase
VPPDRNALAAFYRRYIACCNEHRFDDLGQFVAHVRAFPDYQWELRQLLLDPPWIGAHLADTGTHREPFLGVPATGRSVSTQEFAFYRIDADQITEVWGTAFAVHLLQPIREQRSDTPP